MTRDERALQFAQLRRLKYLDYWKGNTFRVIRFTVYKAMSMSKENILRRVLRETLFIR